MRHNCLADTPFIHDHDIIVIPKKKELIRKPQAGTTNFSSAASYQCPTATCRSFVPANNNKASKQSKQQSVHLKKYIIFIPFDTSTFTKQENKMNPE